MMFVDRSVRCSAPRQTEALHGQRLIQSLPDGRCRARVVALQRPGRPLQHRRRAVRRIEVPRIPQRLAGRGVQPLGEMDVPAPMFCADIGIKSFSRDREH